MAVKDVTIQRYSSLSILAAYGGACRAAKCVWRQFTRVAAISPSNIASNEMIVFGHRDL